MPYIQRKVTHRYCQTCDTPFPIKYRRVWNCESCIAQITLDRKKNDAKLSKERWVKIISFLIFPIGILIYFATRKNNPELATLALNKVLLAAFLIVFIFLAVIQA